MNLIKQYTENILYSGAHACAGLFLTETENRLSMPCLPESVEKCAPMFGAG